MCDHELIVIILGKFQDAEEIYELFLTKIGVELNKELQNPMGQELRIEAYRCYIQARSASSKVQSLITTDSCTVEWFWTQVAKSSLQFLKQYVENFGISSHTLR